MVDRPTQGVAPDRRVRRRQETLAEICDRAVELMATSGVAGLTMTELARAMAIRPPSLYKYFPSVLAVYEDLFRRGHQANLEVLEEAIAGAEPGLPALRAGMEAQARWAVAHPVIAQLLFWRPVPGFVPSAEAMAPADSILELLRSCLHDAVAAGQLRAEATGEAAMTLLSVLHFGVLSQHLANSPEQDWESGPYTRLYSDALAMFTDRYHPEPPELRGHPADAAQTSS